MVNGAAALDFAPEPKPIHNIEAEQALLGALLINNQVFWAVDGLVDAQHFYDPLHARIFDAIMSTVRAGKQATPVTLKPQFDYEDLVGNLTVPQYLGRLAASAVSLLSAKDYAATIRDFALRRMMLIIGQELVDEAHRDHSVTAADIIERAESRLYEIAERGDRKGPVHVSEALARAAERLEKAVERGDGVTGVATGIYKLDRETGGLMPSNLIVLAGRPAMGKTALGLNIALNVAKEGTPALFFSLEMSADELADRALGSDAGISISAMRRGLVDATGLQSVGTAVNRLSGAPLYVDDTGGATVDQVVSRARRLVRLHGIKLIVVDYLQIMRSAARSRYESITDISNGLKTLAKELDVPVLALSQLSRANETRDDKKPQLADLRESGAIEQDADMVWFVHREEYYKQRQEPDGSDIDAYTDWQAEMSKLRNKADLIIAKNRHGPCSVVKLHFDGAHTRFTDGGE